MNFEELPKLTEKENKAVLYYCTDCLGNKSAAYRKAYDCKNSSEKTIWKEASKLFSNPRVTPWIEYYNKVLQQHTETEIKYTRTDLFEELERIRVKTEDSNKTVGIALKCVEIKAKASGLLKDNIDNSTKLTVQMGAITHDDKTLNFDVGEDVNTSTDS